MATAIELYAQAYDLDYRKGDWQTAEELYKEILERFPYSDEKEYALVHLDRIEKLKSGPGDVTLQPVRAVSGVNGLSVVTFILVLLVGLAVGYGGLWGWKMYQKQQYDSLLVQGALSEKAGDLGVAHESYKQAIEILAEESLAYRHLAELYLAHGQKDLAAIEYERWKLADPFDPALKSFNERHQKNGLAQSSTQSQQVDR